MPLPSPLFSLPSRNHGCLQTHELSFCTPSSSTRVSGFLQILPAGNRPLESYLLTRAPSADERVTGNTATGQLLVCLHVGAGRGHFLPLGGIGSRAENFYPQPTLCRGFSDPAAQTAPPPPPAGLWACELLLETGILRLEAVCAGVSHHQAEAGEPPASRRLGLMQK